MTKESLEQGYNEAHQAYEKQGLNALTDDQLKHIALYEVWSDGADWDTVIQLQGLYSNRDNCIKALQAYFGY